MPATTGDLVRLRSTPQRSRMFLVVQQPEYWQGSLYGEEFLWSCQIDGVHGDDPTVQLTVDNGGPNATLFDRMTVLIGSTPGGWDRGFFCLRGDQNVGPGTVTLDVAPSSEVDNNVLNDDYVTVLDEFRLWTRYPRVTEAAGALSWFKDWDITWAGLGANDTLRTQAAMPPVPIMGPHRVRFIDPGDSVDIDFDWSDSYAMAVGAAVNAWASEGERASGNWVSAVQNPPAQTYTDDDISGLSGYRVWLELGTDAEDPTAPYMRGVRYVFTLRRPGQRQDKDPTNAEPIINFEVSPITGTFDQGRWRTSIRVFGSDAAENVFLPGALVILFAEDYYAAVPTYIGPDTDGVGPIVGSENVVMVGRIADGTIQEDSQTGEISFDVISLAEQASLRANYPIPIENYGAASDEWYRTHDLTISRAIWHYTVWHTTVSLIADLYLFDRDPDSTPEIFAQDFLAGDIYATIDRFASDRVFARLLIDRYERCAVHIDLQMEGARSGDTLFKLEDADWINAVSVREIEERRVNLVELGGVVYTQGNLIPYLSNAPGNVSGYMGRPESHTNLAIASQADLNTLSGRLYAYRNSRFPQGTFQMAGNWRVGDIWPQEYIITDVLVTQRRTFTDRWWVLREITYTYDATAGAIMTTFGVESETDGPPGETVDIPAELPDFTVSPIPRYPPSQPPTPTVPSTGPSDEGRRMVGTDVGVFVTDDIGATNPIWYGSNAGLATADELDILDIKRDPWRWWTSGGTERRLYAFNKRGVWYQDDFPTGTWVCQIDRNAILGGTGFDIDTAPINTGRMDLSIEVQNLYAVAFSIGDDAFDQKLIVMIVEDGVITRSTNIATFSTGWDCVKFAPHGAGDILYWVPNIHCFNIISSTASLYKSINRGVGWVVVDGPYGWGAGGYYTSISIPYVDPANPDSYVFWGRGGGIAGTVGHYRISEDQGVTFADVPDMANAYSRIGTGGDPNYIFFLGGRLDVDACKWSRNKGVAYTDLPLIAGGAATTFASWVYWQGGYLQSVLAGYLQGGAIRVDRWTAPGGWANKTGNLNTFGIGEITQVDRDSMGVA